MAEREGFEPPMELPPCRISSAVLSTTQPPLRVKEPAIDKTLYMAGTFNPADAAMPLRAWLERATR